MKTIPVVACASSRLQADMMLIRLRRVGISCQKVAALFHRRQIPNSVACWLKVQDETPPRNNADAVTLAGSVRSAIAPTRWDARSVADLLTDIGLDFPSARSFAEKLSEGKVILIVSALHETEASIAWHIFKHVSAEQIAMGGTGRGRVLSTPRDEEMAASFHDVPDSDSFERWERTVERDEAETALHEAVR